MRNRIKVLIWEKQAREQREITVSEIAEAVDVSRQTVHTYLNNKLKSVNLETVEKFCKYFGCEIGDLFHIEAEPEAQQ